MEEGRGVRRTIVAVLVLIVCHFSCCPARAQVSVVASIDSIEMFIGQQAHVTVTATMKEGAKAEFPVFKPQEFLTPGVEVLGSREEGTKGAENGLVERSVVYTLTSFDDTLYYLPPFKVKVDGKVLLEKAV